MANPNIAEVCKFLDPVIQLVIGQRKRLCDRGEGRAAVIVWRYAYDTLDYLRVDIIQNPFRY
jgi:hypothetical protein